MYQITQIINVSKYSEAARIFSIGSQQQGQQQRLLRRMMARIVSKNEQKSSRGNNCSQTTYLTIWNGRRSYELFSLKRREKNKKHLILIHLHLNKQRHQSFQGFVNFSPNSLRGNVEQPRQQMACNPSCSLFF